jgi:hypothetical protein
MAMPENSTRTSSTNSHILGSAFFAATRMYFFSISQE